MKLKLTTQLLLILLALTCSSLAWGQACTRTSDFMELACTHEAKEDLWIGYANCKNMAPANRLACYLQQIDNRSEAWEECEELKDSRNAVCELVGDEAYNPIINPDNFLSPEEAANNPNPFFPLIPGTVTIYEVTEDVSEDSDDDSTGPEEIELTEIITVTVTDETREILGVECFVVNDVVTDPDGEVIEDTDDYYAVDEDNNVWYFGEIAKNYEDGYLTDLEGSFISGEEGAKPGIIMLANPMPDDAYRQEFFLDDAEDYAIVLSLAGDESTPAADCDGACLVINDLNALEPDANEDKFYKAGIGVVAEVDNVGTERSELVEIINPD